MGGEHEQDHQKFDPRAGRQEQEQELGEAGRDREGSASDGQAAAARQISDVHVGESGAPVVVEPPGAAHYRSPLFHAQQAARYDRQQLIRRYQDLFDCRLIVMIDQIFPDSVTYFEDLLFDADPDQDLHMMLASPGGDGEVAVRLARAAQSRCREFTVLVPDQAKSAATILALGAHHILMGPTSDLGPVDPQFRLGNSLVSAKDMIEAVERALQDVARNPDTYPLHAALLSDVNGLMVQQARSALSRTADLVDEALRSNPDRSGAEVGDLVRRLKEPLIAGPEAMPRSWTTRPRSGRACRSSSVSQARVSGGSSGSCGPSTSL